MPDRKYLIVIGLLCITSLLVAACVPASGGVVSRTRCAALPRRAHRPWRVRDRR